MIKTAKKEGAALLAGMAVKMWSDSEASELKEGFRELAGDDSAVCFIKYIGGKGAAARGSFFSNASSGRGRRAARSSRATVSSGTTTACASTSPPASTRRTASSALQSLEKKELCEL